MTLKGDAKLTRKLGLGLKNDIKKFSCEQPKV